MWPQLEEVPSIAGALESVRRRDIADRNERDLLDDKAVVVSNCVYESRVIDLRLVLQGASGEAVNIYATDWAD
jgi:hypothetical protein